MFRLIDKLFRKTNPSHSGRKPTTFSRPRRLRLGVESLESRELMSVSTLTDVFTVGDTFSLGANHQLMRYDGHTNSVVDNNCQAIASGVDTTGARAVWDLQTNGNLYSYTRSGGWALLDTGVQAIASSVTASGQPGLFDLENSGRLYSYGATGWTLLDTQTSNIATGATSSGQTALFDLESSGRLYQYSVGGWTLLDTQTKTIGSAVTAGGQTAIFDLETSGKLYQYSVGGWTSLDTQTQTIVIGATSSGQAALFDLETSGRLYQYSVGGWTLLDTQTQSITTGVTAGGQAALYDLEKSGTLYQYGSGGWKLLNDASSSGLSLTSMSLNDKVVAAAQKQLGNQVGNGQCTELAIWALHAAGAATTYDYHVSGLNADYVWGSLVYEHDISTPVSSGGGTIGGSGSFVSATGIRAGDIIQYRNVIITATATTPGWTVSHHTAVIEQVLGNGVYKVLEQNISGDMHVREDIINLNAMTAGTVWIYQPVVNFQAVPL